MEQVKVHRIANKFELIRWLREDYDILDLKDCVKIVEDIEQYMVLYEKPKPWEAVND